MEQILETAVGPSMLWLVFGRVGLVLATVHYGGRVVHDAWALWRWLRCKD